MREPTYDLTPDGTYVFETEGDDGTRVAAAILPEDVDEVAGRLGDAAPTAEERRRRYQVARLLAEAELRRQLDETAAYGAARRGSA